MLEDRVIVWRFNHGRPQVLHHVYEKYKTDLLTLAMALLGDLAAYDYDWAPRLDPAEFEPAMPEDYKLVADAEVSANGESLVEGLRFFAEYANGKPSSPRATAPGDCKGTGAGIPSNLRAAGCPCPGRSWGVSSGR